MKKRTIDTIIIIMIILSTILSMSAMAAGGTTRASLYISDYNVGITKSSTTLTVSYSVTGTGTMTSIGASSITIYVQNGSSWNAVTTFSYPATASLRSANTVTHTSSVSFAGTSGKVYYAVVNFYAGNSSGSDTRQGSTSSITL